MWHELIHMYVAAYVVTGFILAAVYAFGRLRGRWGRYERTAVAIALTVAALASIVQGPVGDWAPRCRKVAADEAGGARGPAEDDSRRPQHLLGWYENGLSSTGSAVPHLLSVLAFHSWNARWRAGRRPADQRPPVNVVRASFQTMVGIGTFLGLIGLVYLLVWIRRKRLPRSAWFYRALILAGPLSVVALIAGWVVTEVGRQPWVVYRVMPTAAAITGAHGIPVGYATLACAYLAVGGGLVWVLRRLARAPLDLAPDAERVLGAA